MQYFAHDTHARRDDKIRLLRHQCSGAAVDCYWSLLELMYEAEGELNLNDKALVFGFCLDLEIDEDQLRSWISEMVEIGLLTIDEDIVRSERAVETVTEYQEKCEKLRTNASKGGSARSGNSSKRKANEKQTKSNCLAIAKQDESKSKANEKQTKSNCGDIKNKNKKKIYTKEKEDKEKEKISSPSTDLPDEIWKGEDTDGFGKFLKDAIMAFNVETKARLPDFDTKTHIALRRIFDHGHTIDDLILVIRSKQKEWQRDKQMKRYIRPSTLFGAKFEEYLMAAQGEIEEKNKYACYE